MSDRTWQELTVYACPPESVGLVLDVIGGNGYAPEYEVMGAPTFPGTLVLGEKYAMEEGTLGTAYNVAVELHDIPGVVAVTSEDPKYEFPGATYYVVPDLPLHEAGSESTGETYLTRTQLYKLIGQAAKDTRTGADPFDALALRIATELGETHLRRIEEAKAALPEDEAARTLAAPDPDPCPSCGHDDRHGDPCPTCGSTAEGKEDELAERESAVRTLANLGVTATLAEDGTVTVDPRDVLAACETFAAIPDEVIAQTSRAPGAESGRMRAAMTQDVTRYREENL